MIALWSRQPAADMRNVPQSGYRGTSFVARLVLNSGLSALNSFNGHGSVKDHREIRSILRKISRTELHIVFRGTFGTYALVQEIKQILRGGHSQKTQAKFHDGTLDLEYLVSPFSFVESLIAQDRCAGFTSGLNLVEYSTEFQRAFRRRFRHPSPPRSKLIRIQVPSFWRWVNTFCKLGCAR